MSHPESKAHTAHGPAAVKDQVKDPVCVMNVDPAATPHYATHGGDEYYFCSAGCRTKFESSPSATLATSIPIPRTRYQA